jgi:hypothetical protein
VTSKLDRYNFLYVGDVALFSCDWLNATFYKVIILQANCLPLNLSGIFLRPLAQTNGA